MLFSNGVGATPNPSTAEPPLERVATEQWEMASARIHLYAVPSGAIAVPALPTVKHLA